MKKFCLKFKFKQRRKNAFRFSTIFLANNNPLMQNPSRKKWQNIFSECVSLHFQTVTYSLRFHFSTLKWPGNILEKTFIILAPVISQRVSIENTWSVTRSTKALDFCFDDVYRTNHLNPNGTTPKYFLAVCPNFWQRKCEQMFHHNNHFKSIYFLIIAKKDLF